MDEPLQVTEGQLKGFRYFQKVMPMLDRLHCAGRSRDRARNRRLHYDQYIALILLYLFNPVVHSVRGMQQASTLKKVQRLLGCSRSSLGSLSEASRVFDAGLLRGVIDELTEELQPVATFRRLDAQTQKVLTLVDGTLLPALPRIASMMTGPHENTFQRRSKLHIQFELIRGSPVDGQVTEGTECEKRVLAQNLASGRIYVMDRGYASHGLMEDIVHQGSSFVVRLQDQTVCSPYESRSLSDTAKAAGVISDQVVRLGSPRRRCKIEKVRRIRIACKPHKAHWKQSHGRGGPRQGDSLLIATDLLDVDAELIALIYQHRWAVEVFFRFLKHVLGCRHLLSRSPNGITIQCYVAIIACLLIALWTGRKPTLRTYEMLCFYFNGLADADELEAHLTRLASVSVPEL